MVEDPIQGGAVAEFVIPGQGRNAEEGAMVGEGDEAAVAVGLEFGFGGYAFLRRGLEKFQGPGIGGFEIEVEVHQGFAPVRPEPKVRLEGNPGQGTLEVDLVFGAVMGIVEHAIDVMENVRLGGGGVLIMGLELSQGPVRDVVVTGAIGGVDV